MRTSCSPFNSFANLKFVKTKLLFTKYFETLSSTVLQFFNGKLHSICQEFFSFFKVKAYELMNLKNICNKKGLFTFHTKNCVKNLDKVRRSANIFDDLKMFLIIKLTALLGC